MDRTCRISLRRFAVLSCFALAFVSAGLPGSDAASTTGQHVSHLAPAEASVGRVATPEPRLVVLVVGDSLVAQSTSALRAMSSSTVDVRVAGMLGSAPCDWTAGDFDAALSAAHPSVVVLAFAGNAGAAAGCVGHGAPRAYPLATLLNSYRATLTELANHATATGATVVLATPPARNPQVPVPPAVPTAAERTSFDAYYGFQGVPQIRRLYAAMANTSGRRWRVSDAAALAVSPRFRYALTLACDSDDGPCPSGVVTVRAGGRDVIHLDPAGHGAKRFARALVGSLEGDTNPVILTSA